jgi:hypothetical protein
MFTCLGKPSDGAIWDGTYDNDPVYHKKFCIDRNNFAVELQHKCPRGAFSRFFHAIPTDHNSSLHRIFVYPSPSLSESQRVLPPSYQEFDYNGNYLAKRRQATDYCELLEPLHSRIAERVMFGHQWVVQLCNSFESFGRR